MHIAKQDEKTLRNKERLQLVVDEYKLNPQPETFEKILKMLKKAIQHMVNKMLKPQSNLFKSFRDDFYQQAVIGLHKGLKAYKSKEGCAFTYLYLYTFGHLQNYYKMEMGGSHQVINYDKFANIDYEDGEENIDVMHKVLENVQPYHDTNIINSLTAWIEDNFNNYDYSLIKDLYMDGFTFAEVGKKHNVSKQAISEYVKLRIKPKLEKVKELVPIWAM